MFADKQPRKSTSKIHVTNVLTKCKKSHTIDCERSKESNLDEARR